MNKTAGGSRTWTNVLKVNDFLVYPGARMTDMEWKTMMYGRPTPQNIERFVQKFNESLEADGANSHLGRRSAIYGGEVVNQMTGETVAQWEDKSIIHFYKSKPMFEVASEDGSMNRMAVARELVAVAEEIEAASRMAALTKRDFSVLADIMKRDGVAKNKRFVDDMVEWLDEQNPQFDEERFREALGM